jgi:hypothetical protein
MSRAGPAAFAAAFVIAASPCRAQTAPPETTEVFVIETGGAPLESIALAKRFILAGTERVQRGPQAPPDSASAPAPQSLAAEIDYRVDPEAGILRLASPLLPGESLTISYSYIPITLPAEIVGLRPLDPVSPDSARAPVQHAGPFGMGTDFDTDLTVGGAKTVALEVGTNKDAAVEQSLRVSVSGTVGENVRLTALLSDQNVPLQPEGNTQRLEELDEVLIKVESPRAGATLGDFLSARNGTPFADYERRLAGAEAVVRHDSSMVRGVGAKARGNFRTLEFRGVEGKQGPYVLTGVGPDPDGVIVAGSERVWLDGQELTRGDANDYVIDYSRGELEFTNRRLITKDSEIAVDVEIAEQEYRRSFYLGEGRSVFAGDRAGLRASVTAETDSDEPLNFTLTEERRQALREAGDRIVLVPGAVCGLDDGDYNEVEGHFVFAGTDSGTCEVSFTFVGVGRGEYVRDRNLDTAQTFFRFVGVGLGDHTPGLFLPAPRTAQLADLGAAGRLGDVGFQLDGAYSREDLNRFSSFDDENNDGGAGQLRVNWLEEAERFGGPLVSGVTATVRGQEAEFTPLGRTRGVFLGERWNFTDSTRADETTAEVDGFLEKKGRWRAGASAGVLDRFDLFRSYRQEGRAEWNGGPVTRASARVETVQRENEADSLGTVEGDLLRARADVDTRFGLFRPGASYWREDRSDERGGILLSGQDDEEFGASLALDTPVGVGARVRAALRTTDVVQDSAWVRESVGTTLESSVEASPKPSVRLRASWILRSLDFEPGRPEPDRTTTLTRSDLTHEHFAGFFRGEYVYETTARTFVDRLSGVAGGEEPGLALAASARIRLGGRTSLFESETFARIEEETVTSDRAPIYLLDFSRFQDDDATVFGKIVLRQEVTLFPSSTAFTVTGRWERIDTEDNQADPQRIEIVNERRVIRARNAIAPRWSVESQLSLDDDRRLDSATEVFDFDLRRAEAREEVIWQPAPSRRISARGSFIQERNFANDSSIRGISIGNAASTAILTRGRLQAEWGWTHPTDVEGIDPSNRFRTRDRDQIDWRGVFELRLSDSISGSFTVSGRALEGIPTTHLMRAEARALF